MEPQDVQAKKHGKDKEDDKSEPPEFAMPLFELLKAGSDGGHAGQACCVERAGDPGGRVGFLLA